MTCEDPNIPAVNPPRKSNFWDWIWPSIVTVIILKFFGVLGGLVTIGGYYWLRPKLGTWGAVVASGVLGTVVGIGYMAMIRT